MLLENKDINTKIHSIGTIIAKQIDELRTPPEVKQARVAKSRASRRKRACKFKIRISFISYIPSKHFQHKNFHLKINSRDKGQTE